MGGTDMEQRFIWPNFTLCLADQCWTHVGIVKSWRRPLNLLLCKAWSSRGNRKLQELLPNLERYCQGCVFKSRTFLQAPYFAMRMKSWTPHILGYEAPENSSSKREKKNHLVCPLFGRNISGLTADYGFPISTAFYGMKHGTSCAHNVI